MNRLAALTAAALMSACLPVGDTPLTGRLCISVSPDMTPEQHEVVLQAVYDWMPLPERFDIAIGGTCRNTIGFREHSKFENPGRRAFTHTEYDDLGRALEADVILSPQLRSETLCVLYETAAHETGHLLGLRAHSANPQSLMADSLSGCTGRTIINDDWQRAWSLYE